MKRGNLWIQAGRLLPVALIPVMVASSWSAPTARAAERQFLVMLAYSPKQGTDPTQLTNKELIRKQYFDKSSASINSFAEYWKEISYGDVTISGDVTGWIALPWSIQPPTDDSGTQITPANYYDLDDIEDVFTYGAGERVLGVQAAIRDLDGDGPNGADDGPFIPAIGSGDHTPRGRAIWMPGERFLDLDGDGRWDGLDEANNLMDWDGDNEPDLLGPWIDLNQNGEPDNNDLCIYLEDGDNDKNPDCCPDGPGRAGCGVFSFDPNVKWDDPAAILSPNRCPATQWEGPESTDWVDCNGNLIPDACDIDCTSADCLATGWLDIARALGLFSGEAGPPVCGISPDRLPFSSGNSSCSADDGNNIPDECEFVNWNEKCVATRVTDPEDPCLDFEVCVPLDPALPTNLPQRCEFDDANGNGDLDVVEPWENFLRRWDPCLVDPDASSANQNSGLAHWVKVYDPHSRWAETTFSCGAAAFASSTMRYGDSSYIENNYPGDASRVIAQTTEREIDGSHDPFGKTSACLCANGDSCRARPGIGPRTCLAGMHKEFDSPDGWVNKTSLNGPNGSTLRTTKMRALATSTGMQLLDQRTPEPDWYEQAWKDRYVGGPTHPLNDGSSPEFEGCEDPASPGTFINCQVPEWPGGTLPMRNIPEVVAFDDVDPDTYDPAVNRRYFHADSGGLNGDGTGWLDCGDLDALVRFETGSVGDGFEQACDAAILPEETNGESAAGIFYDGWVEHDDLPSSKYHMAGDQRLGEVTSPSSSENGKQIWGQDLGPNNAGSPPVLDNIIEPAGPYATGIHGNFPRDAGNLLTMELLTWRTRPPFNNGTAWEDRNGHQHPYAGPSGEQKGFRDYNLDGMIDQGEVRPAGSENYLADSITFTTNDGTASEYPFNRRRLLEDCIEALDSVVDFDGWVDPVAMDAFLCEHSFPFPNSFKPRQYAQTPSDLIFPVSPDGVLSGIVLLPEGSHDPGDFPLSPSYYPIHTEDGTNPALRFPQSKEISWNLFFHDLVIALDTSPRNEAGSGDFQTAFAAHEYLHTWERFPDLYDYDVFFPTDPGPPVNTPIGRWDIMATGGLVHPVPILKEKPCTSWIKPIDLTTVLTPGVEAVVTLPPAEFARNGYFFLENPNLLGERYYFWSAGGGFDRPGAPSGGLPGTGMLVMHTDVGANPRALPSGQTNETRFEFLIVQADGLGQLEAGEEPFGDTGDPWPGSTGNTRFNFDTVPAATWYTQNSWTGLDITDIVPDGTGSVQVSMTWVPTTIPNLSFIDPPGGASVGSIYQVRLRATDVFGGTTIKVYYTDDETDLTIQPGDANLVGTLRKTTPGTNDLSVDWDISAIPDGRYLFFAELIPGAGAGGAMERSATHPRPGRNNVGEGTLTVDAVNVAPQKARLETWTARMVDIDGAGMQDWRINATLSQPEPDEDAADPDPFPHLFVPSGGSASYTSPGDEVKFTIANSGANFMIGDSWSFVTTGITALSAGVTITDGKITEGPVARITASPLSGPPPLQVTFDGRESIDPNGGALAYQWDFGDASPVTTSAAPTHTFSKARTFTVTLRVTSELSGLFSESSVDIEVSNNEPSAVLSATPTSGPAPLTVQFDASLSADTETAAEDLIYQWDFGDGATANDAGGPGILIDTEHFYSKQADGTPCTTADPCTFVAKLTVTDEGGKQGVDSVEIQVGNTKPLVNISHSALQGPAPFEVVFNAINSTDEDGDDVEVEWAWGDGTANETVPVTGADGDGAVPHTYESPGTYQTTAVLTDGRGGRTSWAGVSVIVTEPVEQSSEPRAIFTVSPETQRVGEPVRVDAGNSFDRPPGDAIASYSWDWGDGTAGGSGVTASHVYRQPGQYTIVLTVADAEDPPNTNATLKRVTIVGEAGQLPGPANRAPEARIIVSGGPVSPNEGFSGDEFTFDASSSSDPDGDALTFDWDFGDGSPRIVDGGAIVTHSFDTARTYVVQLTVKDTSNLAKNATQTVIVRDASLNEEPVPFITTGPRSGSAPLSLMFDSELSFDPNGDPLAYAWYVSDTRSEVRLSVDPLGDWVGTIPDAASGDSTNDGSSATICPEDNGGVRVFWTSIDCDARPNGTEDIEILPSSNDGATLDAVFRSQGEFTVSLEVSDGLMVVRSDPEQVTVAARSTATEPPSDGGGSNGGGSPSSRAGGRRSTGICGFGMLIGLLGSLLGLTVMMTANRRFAKVRNR